MIRLATLIACLSLSTVSHAKSTAADYGKTRYPIMLVHGAGGWGKMFNAYEYWYGLVEAMQADGGTVYITQLSAFNSAEVRGEQLLKQVQRVLAITGADKVNLIGHSFGGLTARYVAQVRPDLVSSVTTVACPNGGSGFADAVIQRFPSGTWRHKALADIFNGAGWAIEATAGDSSPNDADQTLDTVSRSGIALFNAKYPAGVPLEACGEGALMAHGIYYFSWGGGAWYTNKSDISDPAAAFAGGLFESPNDGVAAPCDTHLGMVVRDNYNFNHIDEVNQLFGLVPADGPNPVALFRMHANRLKQLGL